ncbi:hypothetical protein NDU88_002541 [Pleurodeles waltl]|uniref:Uncharacterized protein n=1 Tax=Pleurodeles waltl TaxID=8319 RepID=A0AAV7KTX8_PLEWA|nr:hypothetical protein NDU88_002541 [Pleurodeles waltl]
MLAEWAENVKESSLNMMRILIKYASKDRTKILEEIDKAIAEILTMVWQDTLEEFRNNLDKKPSKFEVDITLKKQRKFICEIKDYQLGRILTFHRKYDIMYTDDYEEQISSVVEANPDMILREPEESDVSDSNLSDASDTTLAKSSGADMKMNRSNFLKQFHLLNQGRTDQRKE